MRSVIPNAVVAVVSLCSSFASVTAQLKPLVNKGCFTSSTGMTDQGSFTYQSPSYCQQQCVNMNKPVMATTQGSNCWCGDSLPVSSSKVADSQCNSPCNGYDKLPCKYPSIKSIRMHANHNSGGGPNAWSIQLTGLNNNVGSQQSTNPDPSSDTSSNSNSNPKSNSNPISNANPNSNVNSNSNSDSKVIAVTTTPSAPEPTPTQKGQPSVITTASTIVVTAPGQSSAQETTIITTTHTPQPKGPNKAGIAAGVVVGIVTLTAIAGGVFFFLRNRKKRAIEEEYRRNVAGGYGAKPPASSAASMSDSRLEPSVMMQRRQSDGSIADNQDYSRRILKVSPLFTSPP